MRTNSNLSFDESSCFLREQGIQVLDGSSGARDSMYKVCPACGDVDTDVGTRAGTGVDTEADGPFSGHHPVLPVWPYDICMSCRYICRCDYVRIVFLVIMTAAVSATNLWSLSPDLIII